ncbi:MAG TPA: KUP/HAK/KT family potassium transporter [Candidatus Babeliales bacterium]|nr:KUP/HAK/KT family potassium transporter [Candidatus Babeliales bacterium]
MNPHSIMKKIGESIQALGIVFGDIGTSPIYTLAVIFTLIPATQTNIYGVLSIIIWILILFVTVQYAWLAMNLTIDKEGGSLILGKIIQPLLKSATFITFTTILSYLGSSLLIGDGIITPAISILSAVEGLRFIPLVAPYVTHIFLVGLACILSFFLFLLQQYGTDKVSRAFGPIMICWFLTLGITGFFWVLQVPSIISALNPIHIYYFFRENSWLGFSILPFAVLSVTGGEALYASMGHLGRAPIVRAWNFAFILLLFCYLGQGAFMLYYPNTVQVFYEMIYGQMKSFSVPFLILNILATAIASQAIISGIFSVVYQGITTQIMPKLKIQYTSRTLRSQIYIPLINWTLFAFVLFFVIRFQTSETLANLYGISTICTMIITGIIMSTIFYLKGLNFKGHMSTFITILEIIILASSSSKILAGGYWTFIIAAIPFSLIMIYTLGKKQLDQSMQPISLYKFVEIYNEHHQSENLLSGTALFLSRSTTAIPKYIQHIMFENSIMYQEQIILSVITVNKPFGLNKEFIDLAPSLRLFEIRAGYMEIVNITNILKEVELDPKVIFYGMEEIEATNIIGKIFSWIKKLTPSFVEFYQLPHDKLHGVVRKVEM